MPNSKSTAVTAVVDKVKAVFEISKPALKRYAAKITKATHEFVEEELGLSETREKAVEVE